MRKFLPLLVTLLLVTSQNHGLAEPPPPGLDITDRIVIEACILT